MGKVSVLIVEDEFIVAQDMRENLSKLGYEVLQVARTGEEAIRTLKQNTPDVILIDIRLGGKIDGIDVIRAIREMVRVPVIYVTAHSDAQTFERAKLTRPQAYIVKPFNFKNLHTAIELALFNFSQDTFGHPDDIVDERLSDLSDHYVLPESIFVKTGKILQKLEFDEIHYIKAGGSYSLIHTAAGVFTLAINLQKVLERLNRPEFLRVHRSFVINAKNMERIDTRAVIVGKVSIPITKKVRDMMLKNFKMIS